MPKQRTRSKAILGEMQRLPTSNGRLFTATVQGPRITLSDTMVAAHRYLRELEEQFGNAADLLRCYGAWDSGGALLPGNVADEQNDLIKRWVNAHHIADAAARKWLSEPEVQYFQIEFVTIG